MGNESFIVILDGVNHITMLRLLLLCVILSSTFAVRAQDKSATAEQLLIRYQKTAADTGSVRVLLRLDSLYLYKMPATKPVLDSGLLMAGQAMNISASLKFKQGYEDARYLVVKSFVRKNNIAAALSTAKGATGTPKVHLLILIGEYYLFIPGEIRQNLDSAYILGSWAKSLSDSLHSKESLYESLAFLGKYYFAIGDLTQGKDYFFKIIHDYHQKGDKDIEAFWLSELEGSIPDTDSTYAEEKSFLNQALTLYRQTGNRKEEPEILEDLAYIHQMHNELVAAEGEQLETIGIKQALGSTEFFLNYYYLSKIKLLEGDYQSALNYALASVRNMEACGDTHKSGMIYFELGDTYRALGDMEQSLRWYRSALDHLAAFRQQFIFFICSRIVHCMLQKDSIAAAFSYLEDFTRNNPPVIPVDKEVIAQAKGDCYNAMGKYTQAESSYLKMIAWDKQELAHFAVETENREMEKMIVGSEAYYTIGAFYVERGEFKLAGPYLAQSLTPWPFAPGLSRQRDIHWMLARVDSAEGNYISAMNHFEQRRRISDSLFNIKKIREIEELKVMYETEQKDSDILHKEQDIGILTRQAQAQATALKEERIARKAIFFASILLASLLVLSYNRYRLKQRNNKQLQWQQQEINEANASLRSLLSEKDALIGEKEWLLKEVHHRVKNNLQIIISLLNTQSKFLGSEEAIAAIRESRHRIQAMSLIHQKLYQSENSALVKMQTFVQELVSYLEASFKRADPVRFDLQVEAIELDVSQAIPIGLILNEAITNALKYAFPENSGGMITISMKKTTDDNIELNITDNGKGLPEDFDALSSNTMGIRLMKGLARQIEARLTLENEGGLTIKVIL
jgi:two-component sensor histidine kinase